LRDIFIEKTTVYSLLLDNYISARSSNEYKEESTLNIGLELNGILPLNINQSLLEIKIVFLKVMRVSAYGAKFLDEYKLLRILFS